MQRQVAVLIPADTDHAFVNSGTQPLVEENFLLAEVVAIPKIPKVEKGEIFRLLEFVDPVTGQKHGGNVGLPEFEP